MNSKIEADSELSALLIGGGILDGNSKSLLAHSLDMTGSERTPNVLHVPTAKATEEAHLDYTERIGRAYESLHATHTVLHDFLLDESVQGANKPPVLERLPSAEELEERILNADLIFVAGGNTRKMLGVWREAGIDKYLDKAIRSGIPVSGISAGAIAWAEGGHSDSDAYETNEPYDETGKNGWTYTYVPALGYIAAAVAPHYDSVKANRGPREASFDQMLNDRQDQVGIGIDNSVALEVVGGRLTVVKATEEEVKDRRKGVYKITSTESGTHKEEL